MALNAPVSPLSSVSSSSALQPSQLTLRRLQSIAGTIDEDDSAELEQTQPVMPAQEGGGVLLEVEDELSEQQLRELYDSEEIDRFLNLFSAVSAIYILPC